MTYNEYIATIHSIHLTIQRNSIQHRLSETLTVIPFVKPIRRSYFSTGRPWALGLGSGTVTATRTSGRSGVAVESLVLLEPAVQHLCLGSLF